MEQGLTMDGRDFITWALDPFADLPRRPVGQCDNSPDPTIVQVLTDEFTLSYPAATGPWSAVIFTTPLTVQTSNVGTFALVSRTSGNITTVGCNAGTNASQTVGHVINQVTGSAPLIGLGLVNVHQWNTDNFGGTSVAFPEGAGAYTLPNTTKVLGPGTQFALNGGIFRLVSLAIELVDLTPPLYQAGLLTVSRTPQATRTEIIPTVSDSDPYNNGWLNSFYPSMHYLFQLPPASVRAALNYQPTKQWPLKEGAYSVATFDFSDNELQNLRLGFVEAMSTTGIQSVKTNSTGFATPSILRNSSFVSASNDVLPVHISPIDNTTMYLTGIPQQGTYAVRVRYIVEIAPTPLDSFAQLVPFAQPSPLLDLKALEIYQRIARSLPPAVPFAMNPLGEWFDTITKAISKVASVVVPVLKKVAGPVAGAFLGPVAGAAASALVNSMSQQQQPAQVTARSRAQKPTPKAVSKTTTGKVVKKPRPKAQR